MHLYERSPERSPIPRFRTGTALLAGALLAAGTLVSTPAAAQDVADAVSRGLNDRFETVSGNILESAQQVPESEYDYRPSDEVRTFGEIVDHVADAHFAYCAAASETERPSAANADATTKSEIIERFRASHDFCLQAYRQVSGSRLGESVSVFGSQDTRAGVLIQNLAHDNLHYGNLVTYQRAIGLVPPSSGE